MEVEVGFQARIFLREERRSTRYVMPAAVLVLASSSADPFLKSVLSD